MKNKRENEERRTVASHPCLLYVPGEECTFYPKMPEKRESGCRYRSGQTCCFSAGPPKKR